MEMGAMEMMDGSEQKKARRRLHKRTAKISGVITSINLEDAFWSGLKQIAGQRAQSVSQVLTEIDANRTAPNLSSAARLYILDYYQRLAVVERQGRRAADAAVADMPLRPAC
jgi:predicted DNA-binding ribbon-helix-helix protein